MDTIENQNINVGFDSNLNCVMYDSDKLIRCSNQKLGEIIAEKFETNFLANEMLLPKKTFSVQSAISILKISEKEKYQIKSSNGEFLSKTEFEDDFEVVDDLEAEFRELFESMEIGSIFEVKKNFGDEFDPTFHYFRKASENLYLFYSNNHFGFKRMIIENAVTELTDIIECLKLKDSIFRKVLISELIC